MLSIAQTPINILTLETFTTAAAGADAFLCLINGSMDGNLDRTFCDVVLVMGVFNNLTASPVVISSTGVQTPATRSYSISANALRLSVSQDTYSIRISALQTANGNISNS